MIPQDVSTGLKSHNDLVLLLTGIRARVPFVLLLRHRAVPPSHLRQQGPLGQRAGKDAAVEPEDAQEGALLQGVAGRRGGRLSGGGARGGGRRGNRVEGEF